MLLIIEFSGTIPSPHRKEKEEKRRKKIHIWKEVNGRWWDGVQYFALTIHVEPIFPLFQFSTYLANILQLLSDRYHIFSGNSIIKWSYHPKGRQSQIRVSERWVVVIKANFPFFGLRKPFKARNDFTWIAFLTFIIVLLNLKRDNTSPFCLFLTKDKRFLITKHSKWFSTAQKKKKKDLEMFASTKYSGAIYEV